MFDRTKKLRSQSANQNKWCLFIENALLRNWPTFVCYSRAVVGFVQMGDSAQKFVEQAYFWQKEWPFRCMIGVFCGNALHLIDSFGRFFGTGRTCMIVFWKGTQNRRFMPKMVFLYQQDSFNKYQFIFWRKNIKFHYIHDYVPCYFSAVPLLAGSCLSSLAAGASVTSLPFLEAAVCFRSDQ